MESRFHFPEGIQFSTILADPPWGDLSPGKRRVIHYDRMSAVEILAMANEIQRISSPDAHLHLWTTNGHMAIACKVLEAWGFGHRTVLTWRKTKLGIGWWLRSRTEHMLWGARTKELRANPGSHETLVNWKYRGHSRKPEEQYAWIEELSPGPYLELFADPETPPREGWYRLHDFMPPAEAHGQEDQYPAIVPDPGDGIVRGVGGLEVKPNHRYVYLQKEITQVEVKALAQKKRKVQVEFNGNGDGPVRKWVTIDSLRPRPRGGIKV